LRSPKGNAISSSPHCSYFSPFASQNILRSSRDARSRQGLGFPRKKGQFAAQQSHNYGGRGCHFPEIPGISTAGNFR
jgi:hypothetical protein